MSIKRHSDKLETSQDPAESYLTMSKPFWLSKLIVDHSCMVVILMTCLFTLLLAITLYFNLYAQSDQNLRDYLVWNSPITLDFDKKVAAEIEIERLRNAKTGTKNNSGSTSERSIEMNSWNAILLYHYNGIDNKEVEDANIWTPQVLS